MGGPGDPKIDTFRAHFVTLSLGPLRGSKWSENGVKMEPKREQNGAKIEQNGAKLETKCIKNRIKHQFDLCVFFYIYLSSFFG